MVFQLASIVEGEAPRGRDWKIEDIWGVGKRKGVRRKEEEARLRRQFLTSG